MNSLRSGHHRWGGLSTSKILAGMWWWSYRAIIREKSRLEMERVWVSNTAHQMVSASSTRPSMSKASKRTSYVPIVMAWPLLSSHFDTCKFITRFSTDKNLKLFWNHSQIYHGNPLRENLQIWQEKLSINTYIYKNPVNVRSGSLQLMAMGSTLMILRVNSHEGRDAPRCPSIFIIAQRGDYQQFVRQIRGIEGRKTLHY